jgi:hypothetical protein
VTGSGPDVLLQRHFEGALSPYEEQLLTRLLGRGGAVADRFVELRELECGLAEYFGGCVRLSRPAAVPQIADLGRLASAEGERDAFRARRFPAPIGVCLQEDCAVELLRAYWRWVHSTDIAAHRRAVVHCMGLILEEPRDVLRCRHRLGMSCRRIAETLFRPLSEIEESIRRIHAFIAGCVRMRLARTG